MVPNKTQIAKFLVIGISAVLFCLTVIAVMRKSPLQFDLTINDWVYSHRIQSLNTIMRILTSLADIKIFAVLLPASCLSLYLLKKRQFILPLFLSTSFSIGSVIVLKELIERERPPVDMAIIKETSFSFPSAHASISLTFYGFLMYVFIKALPNNLLKTLAIIFFTSLIFLMAFSRVYLGVHWLTDVLGAELLNIPILILTIILFENRELILKKIKWPTIHTS